MAIELNIFDHINPHKIFDYDFIERFKQAYYVFHGNIDRSFSRRAGLFDYPTIGIGIFATYCYEKTKSAAQTESRLFYLPLAPLVVVDLLLRAARIIFSVVMTVLSALVIVPLHVIGLAVNCCKRLAHGEVGVRIEIDDCHSDKPTPSSTGKTLKKMGSKAAKVVEKGAKAVDKGVHKVAKEIQHVSHHHTGGRPATTLKLKF
jgi:hypothetical protein